MDIWVVSSMWLLWIQLLSTVMFKYVDLHFSFLLSKLPKLVSWPIFAYQIKCTLNCPPEARSNYLFFFLQITFLILPTNTHLPAKPDYPPISAEPRQCLDSTVAPFSAFGVSSHCNQILTPHLSPIANASFHKLPLIHPWEVISPFTELCTALAW